MDTLTAARLQMTVSLAFHMVFAAVGIGLPLLMVIVEGLWLRTRQEHYRALAKKWAKATGLLFAVGAVSGTALSFELGLLWPRYMELTGAVVGHIFALEGYAFFIEAIFLGLYLYGWDRLSPVGALVVRRGDRRQRHALGRPGPGRERLDAAAGRLRTGGRPGRRDRPDRHLQAAALVPHGAALDAVVLHRRRLRRRRRCTPPPGCGGGEDAYTRSAILVAMAVGGVSARCCSR